MQLSPVYGSQSQWIAYSNLNQNANEEASTQLAIQVPQAEDGQDMENSLLALATSLDQTRLERERTDTALMLGVEKIQALAKLLQQENEQLEQDIKILKENISIDEKKHQKRMIILNALYNLFVPGNRVEEECYKRFEYLIRSLETEYEVSITPCVKCFIQRNPPLPLSSYKPNPLPPGMISIVDVIP